MSTEIAACLRQYEVSRAPPRKSQPSNGAAGSPPFALGEWRFLTPAKDDYLLDTSREIDKMEFISPLRGAY